MGKYNSHSIMTGASDSFISNGLKWLVDRRHDYLKVAGTADQLEHFRSLIEKIRRQYDDNREVCHQAILDSFEGRLKRENSGGAAGGKSKPIHELWSDDIYLVGFDGLLARAFPGIASQAMKNAMSENPSTSLTSLAIPLMKENFQTALAFAVLSLVSGISSIDEFVAENGVIGYDDFQSQHYKDVLARVTKKSWGLRNLYNDEKKLIGFDTTDQFWLRSQLREHLEGYEAAIKTGVSFNDQFRLAQNSVLVEYLWDETTIWNQELFREIQKCWLKHPSMFLIGVTDMPLSSYGLQRCEKGRAIGLSDRDSAFHTRLYL